MPVKTAIIGLGHIGKIHIRTIEQFKDLKLVAVCDRISEFKSFVPEGVDYYTDYEELLLRKDIDTVIIATPNHTHYYIARTVLNEGFNIILEKPAAESIDELEELERVASQNNLQIYYAFHAASAFDVEWFLNYWHDPMMRSTFGPVTGFLSRFYDSYVDSGVLKSEAEGLQNPWLDSGINALTVIQRFIPFQTLRIENASAAISQSGKPRFLQCHVEYSFSVDDENHSTGLGVIDTNWTTGRNHKSTILQFAHSGKYVRMCHSSQRVFIKDSSKMEEYLLQDCSRGENRLFNHYIGVFRDYLSHYKKGIMNNKDSLTAHRILFETEARINQTL